MRTIDIHEVTQLVLWYYKERCQKSDLAFARVFFYVALATLLLWFSGVMLASAKYTAEYALAHPVIYTSDVVEIMQDLRLVSLVGGILGSFSVYVAYHGVLTLISAKDSANFNFNVTEVLREVAKHIEEGQVILDVGCVADRFPDPAMAKLHPSAAGGRLVVDRAHTSGSPGACGSTEQYPGVPHTHCVPARAATPGDHVVGCGEGAAGKDREVRGGRAHPQRR